MSVTVELVTDPADRDAAFAIRHVVFVVEQQVPVEEELDGADADADHLLARVDGVPTGTARLVTAPDGTGIVGRVAVLAAARGHGVGAALMRAVERRAVARGLRRLDLHAQVQVRGFYAGLGYAAHGEEFVEAGIRHVSMAKDLAG